jgi:hypothetical protein
MYKNDTHFPGKQSGHRHYCMQDWTLESSLDLDFPICDMEKHVAYTQG